MTDSQVIEEMRKKGCRITKQRRIILDVILNYEFNSCKEIYYRVIRDDPTIGMATVYRMINLLEEMNIIRRIEKIEVIR